MGGLFSPEGKFSHYGGKLADLMLLNILMILCCLPIVTAGASLTAMHYVLLKIYRDEEGKIAKNFLQSFRENLKQSTIMFLIFGTAIYLLLVSMRMIFFSQIESIGFIRYLLPFVMAAVICVFNWTLILQSRYKNTIMGTIRIALMTCFVNPIRSVIMALLSALPTVMLLLAAENLIILVMAGFALTGFLQTCLYSGVFDKLENTNARDLAEQ